jgi:hypothetical protein
MSARSWIAAAAALVGLCVGAPEAAAEDRTPKKDDSYGYIFSDDVIDAGNPNAAGGVVNVIRLGRRDRLLRPRVHFVPEMLKSVETM